MKNKQFDNNLKDGLQQYSSDIDAKALWNDIESKVDAINESNQKKERFFFWYFLLGITFIASLGYLVNHSPLPTSDKENYLANGNLQTPTITSTKKNSPVLSELTNNTPTSPVINLKKGLSNEQSVNEDYFSKNNSDISKSINPSFYPSENKTPNNNISTFSTKTKTKNQKTNLSNTSNTLSEIITPLPSLDLLLKENTDFNISLNEAKQLPYNNSNKKFKLSLSIQGGIHNTTRTLERNLSELTDYLNLRKQTEEVLETFNFNTLVSIAHLPSGLELTTGVQWTQITEKFEFMGSTFESDTIENGLFGYIINPNGDTIPVYDEVINQREILHNKRTYNRYRLIEIPILVGHHWTNNTWSLGLEVGMFANLALKTSGNIFTPETLIMDIEKEQNQVFKSKVGLSYYFGFSAKYALTENLQITANPSFRYYPNNFTLSNYPLKQSYHLMGGNIGLRYSF